MLEVIGDWASLEAAKHWKSLCYPRGSTFCQCASSVGATASLP